MKNKTNKKQNKLSCGIESQASMNMLNPQMIERQNQIKVATQDAWEAAGQLDELIARINYVRNYNSNVKLLKKIGAAVQASALYRASKECFTHLAAHEVEYLFSNINVRMDLLKSLRINDMTLVEITVEDLIAHNANLDCTDLDVYTKKLTEVIKASFSGKRKNKNVLLDVQSYVNESTNKLKAMRNIENLGSVVRVYKLSGFDHLPSEDKFFANVKEIETYTTLPLYEQMIVDEYGLNADMVLAVCNTQEYRTVSNKLVNDATAAANKALDNDDDHLFYSIIEYLKSNLVHAILHFEGVYTFEFNNVVADLEVYFNDVQIPAAEENLPLVSEPAVVVSAATTPAEITPPAAEENLPTKKEEPAVESTPAVTTPAAEPVEEILEEVSLDVRQAQRDAAELIDAQIVAADQYELEELPGEDWNLSGDSIQVDNVDGYSLCYRIAVNTFKAGGVRMSSGETRRVYVKDASYTMYKAAQDQKNKQRAQEAMMW